MTASHPYNPRPAPPATNRTHQETQAEHAHPHNHHAHYHHPYNNTHNHHQHLQNHSHNDQSQYYYNNNNNNSIHAVPEVSAAHEYNQPTEESPQPSALWLLNHPSVNRELQRMALRLVERQRQTDDPGVSPCLFVVLPKTSRGLFSASAYGEEMEEGEDDEYWLYFLCDFMMPESTMPQLHVCSPPLPPTPAPPPPPPQVHPRGYPKYSDHYHHHHHHHHHHPSHFPPTAGTRPTITTYPGGYQLRDLEGFIALHALPMLSLLYLVDQANGPDNSPEWTDRIRGGIRFLAEKCKEDLVDIFEEDTQVSPSPEMDSEGGLSGYPRDDVDQEDDRGRDGEYWEGESEEDEDEEDDDEEDNDGDGDEEAESGLMMLREDDFRDPWRVAGKSITTASSRSSISSVDGINFDSLDLNRRSSEQQRQDDPSGSTEAGASEGGGGGGGGGGVLILGADVLCQVNHPFIPGGILWLCEAHNEMLCKGMAAEKLRQFIKSKKGNCIPMEKSAEIQFREREDARVFYRMLDEYKCVIKLKIGLDFDVLEGGVTEEDMWELCWAIHCSTVRDLTVDCGGGGGGASFRPLLGMMCRMGFVALTVENFDGSFLSPDEPLFTHSTSRRSSRSNSASHHTNVDADVDIAVDVETSPSPSSVASQQQPFSLIDFRASPTIMSLPDNIQLKKLTFRHWTRVPDRRAIINLIRVLPNLTELETMTDSVEMLCQAIQDELQVQAQTETSRATYHPLSHLNLLEVGQYGSEAEFTLSKPSGSEGNIRILETHWKTNQSPRGLGMLQSSIGLETLEFTQCVGLWEMAPELQRIVGYNYSTLRKVEIVCATERMADVWVILRREFMQPMTIGSPEARSSTSNGSFITNSSSPTDTGSHHSRRVSGGSDNSFSHHQQRQRHQQLKHRGPVHLLIHDRAGHILESPNVEQYDQTILDLGQYDETFCPQLELQCQIASQIRISPGLADLQQLHRLSQDVGAIMQRVYIEGLMFSLRELVVCLTSRTFEDVEFMKAIWNLMDQLQGLQSLTIQMHDDGSTLSSTKRIQGGGRQDKSQGQDMMPRRLLEAFRRVARIEVGSYWNERFERWMQELLVQEVMPIRRGVAFPPGLPVQGGFVFGASEDLAWREDDALLVGGGSDDGGVVGKAGVVYSLTFYRP